MYEGWWKYYISLTARLAHVPENGGDLLFAWGRASIIYQRKDLKSQNDHLLHMGTAYSILHVWDPEPQTMQVINLGYVV